MRTVLMNISRLKQVIRELNYVIIREAIQPYQAVHMMPIMQYHSNLVLPDVLRLQEFLMR